jgi:hypothetical protein
MSAFYNNSSSSEKKEGVPASSQKDVYLPAIHMSNNSNSILDVGQKRAVPWLEEDNRDTKAPRTEEKQGNFLNSRLIVVLIHFIITTSVLLMIQHVLKKKKNGK